MFINLDSPPLGLEDTSKYPLLFNELLKDPNWTEEDISLLAGKNFLRVFKSVENVRDYWKRAGNLICVSLLSAFHSFKSKCFFAGISPLETISPPKYSSCTYMPS